MRINPIFKDGAVFPANKIIRIYGESSGNVKITFNGVVVESQPKEGNVFIAELPSFPYGGPYTMTIEGDNETVVLKDVYVGEVFLMSGQSNMMFKVQESKDDLSDGEDDDLLRVFTCDHVTFSDDEIEYFRRSMGWVKCKKDEIEKWSSLAYQVGKNIRKKRNVAVGVICCYQDASVIESWLPKEVLSQKDIYVEPDKKHYDHHDEHYRLWNEDSRLFELVLKQAVPYSVSAVVWYQGESDTTEEEGKIYDLELQGLMGAWRKAFLCEDLPFVIVQIANFDYRNDEGWHAVQKAQERAVASVENSFLVISLDVCASNEIHPPKKKLLAKRIADTIDEKILY